MPVIALLIGAALAAADQLFKMLIVNNFALGETRPLIPHILNLTYPSVSSGRRGILAKIL